MINIKRYTKGNNAFVVKVNDAEIFFSYETPVAIRLQDIIYLTNERFGPTTRRHINSIKTNPLYEDKTKVPLDKNVFIELTNQITTNINQDIGGLL